MSKIVPINVIITKGNFKGLIGELIGIEETVFGDRFHIKTPCGNIITDRNVIEPIEIGWNYMPLRNLVLDEIKDIKFINQLPNFDKNEIKDSIIKIDDNVRKRNSRLTNNVLRGRYKWKNMC